MNELEFLEKTQAFLGEMGIVPNKPKFYVEINLDAAGKPSMVYSSDTDTVFRLDVRPSEWELLVNKPRKASWARFYADEKPFISKDDFKLFKPAPLITSVWDIFHKVEKKLGIRFPRVAYVRTNIAGAKKAATTWVAKL
jgi:hypothetical protein